MNSIADKININLLELFSVILPGGLLLLMISQIECLKELSVLTIKDNGTSVWYQGFALFACSYFVGYLCYTGSSFLDLWYNRLKLNAVGRKSEISQRTRLTRKDTKMWARILLPKVHHTHNLINEVISLKVKYMDASYHAPDQIDAFQWSYRFLMIRQPLMFSEVERYYATARFFRSMTMVLFFGAFLFLFKWNWLGGIIFMLISILSFLLFLNRWQKANHVAFKNVLVLDGEENYRSSK